MIHKTTHCRPWSVFIVTRFVKTSLLNPSVNEIHKETRCEINFSGTTPCRHTYWCFIYLARCVEGCPPPYDMIYTNSFKYYRSIHAEITIIIMFVPENIAWSHLLYVVLTRYAKLWVAHTPGMPATFSPPPLVCSTHHLAPRMGRETVYATAC